MAENQEDKATNPERPSKRTKTTKKVADRKSAASTGSTGDDPPTEVNLYRFSQQEWERLNGLARRHYHSNRGNRKLMTEELIAVLQSAILEDLN